MQRLKVSGAVRLIYRSLGVKGLINIVVFDYIPFPVLTHNGDDTLPNDWKELIAKCRGGSFFYHGQYLTSASNILVNCALKNDTTHSPHIRFIICCTW